nr:hypothetical protein [Flavobacterium sp.]
MSQKTFSFIVCLLFSHHVLGYQITANISNLKTHKCLLGYYFGSANQFVYVDTARVDTKGNFIFEQNKQLPEGLYFIEIPSKKRFELVIGQAQNFSLSSSIIDFSKNIKFVNSEDNTLYYQYINFVRPRQALLKTRLTPEQSTRLQQELYAFQTTFFKEKSEYLATRILAAGEVP